MRTAFLILGYLCAALTASPSCADPRWAADAEGVWRVTTNPSTRVASIPQPKQLAATRDGGAWAMSAQRLVRISRLGTVDADVDLPGRGYGHGLRLAVDPYDDSVWIGTDARLLLHFWNDGALAHGTSLPAAADSLVVALDQTPWLTLNGELAHFSRAGQPLALSNPRAAAVGTSIGLAIDSLHAQAWIADSRALWRIPSSGGLPDSDGAAMQAPRAMTLDVRSGDLWVVVEQRLVAIDREGNARTEIDLSDLPGEDSAVLEYDSDGDSIVLQVPGRLARISPDGRILESLPLPASAFVATPPPFRVHPTLALLRPPAGGATNESSPELTLRFGATCNEAPCDPPDKYATGLRLVTELDGIQAPEATIDPATRSAVVTPRLLLQPGVHRLTARAADRFSHDTVLTATFSVLERVPVETVQPDREPRTADAHPSAVLKAPNKAPTVALTSPASGATFSAGADIPLAATASDADGAISKVEFYRAGSTLIGTATTMPYQAVWQNAAAGSYTLTAKAYDTKNGTATSAPVTVIVSNNQLPAVALTSPVQGAFYPAGVAIQLAATASDPDGSVTNVEFLDGTMAIGVASNGPFALSWTGASPGTHSLVARATDDKGGTRTSPAIDIVVGQPPLVVVKSPAACSSVDGPLDLVLVADAVSKTGGVTRVEFFDGETLVGTSSDSPWHVTLSAATVGRHSITARAIDDHGLDTTSRPAIVTVRGANQTPGVMMTSPTEGARYALGSTVNLAATATDSDGTVTAVEYRIGGSSGTLIGRATSAPYPVSWTNMAAGSYTLVAVAFDDRNASGTSAAVHVTIAPNVPPSVAMTTPSMNASYTAPATIALAANASDSDGSIAKVEFFAGTTLIGAYTAVPYATAWNNVASGTYSLTARATDNTGGVATSPPVSVSVVSNAPPAVTLTAPSAGGHYFAPATIVLSATALDTDGSIGRVDFHANGALAGTATTAPYSVVWDGVSGGAYSITATAVDNLGRTTTTPAVTITVSAASDLAFAAGLDGSTIDDDNLLVQGNVSTPANSALTVNGIVTHIDDFGNFHANDIPLAPGANTVTAVVTTQDGQTTSRSINVGSTGRGTFVVRASPTEGLNTLQVTFTVENPGNANLKQIVFDFDNDGFPNVIATPDQFADGTLTVTATYPVGTWLAAIKAYDDEDRIIYSTRKSIVVLMPAALETNLRAIYAGMLNRLKAGNISGALTAFTGAAYARYNAIFTQLRPTLPSIVDQLGDIREVNFGQDLAELSVVRNTPEGPRRFLLYLIRAEDGIWRFDGM